MMMERSAHLLAKVKIYDQPIYETIIDEDKIKVISENLRFRIRRRGKEEEEAS